MEKSNIYESAFLIRENIIICFQLKTIQALHYISISNKIAEGNRINSYHATAHVYIGTVHCKSSLFVIKLLRAKLEEPTLKKISSKLVVLIGENS